MLVLADPFQAAELPEVIEEYLEHGVAKCAAFNRRGTLLAGACCRLCLGYVRRHADLNDCQTLSLRVCITLSLSHMLQLALWKAGWSFGTLTLVVWQRCCGMGEGGHLGGALPCCYLR